MASRIPWEKIEHRQRRALGRYLRDEVHAFSHHYRVPLERARLAGGSLSSLGDLHRLPVTDLAGVDPGEVVLRPTEDRILRRGRWRLRWGAVVAKVANKPATVNRLVIEPAYKPVHWQLHDGFPVGYSSEDLDRLAEAGRQWLEQAGVRRSDVIVSLLPDGPHLGFWELALGARAAGVAHLALPPGQSVGDVARVSPTVLAGTSAELGRVLSAPPPAGPDDDTGAVRRPPPWPPVSLATLLVVDEPLDDAGRAALASAAKGAAVVNAYAPPGVRALWHECRTGAALHTDPRHEVVEIVTDGKAVAPGEVGDVVWTGLGWRGTVLLRLDTGLRGRLEVGECPHCARMQPRLTVEHAPPPPDPLAQVLEDHPEVVAWYGDAEAGSGRRRAVVALRDRRRQRRVLADLAEAVPDVDLTVATRPEVEARLAGSNGDRPAVPPG